MAIQSFPKWRPAAISDLIKPEIMPFEPSTPKTIPKMKHEAGPSSAFEKWSGHVEPKGSRVGCLGISPREKKGIHPFPEAIL